VPAETYEREALLGGSPEIGGDGGDGASLASLGSISAAPRLRRGRTADEEVEARDPRGPTPL